MITATTKGQHMEPQVGQRIRRGPITGTVESVKRLDTATLHGWACTLLPDTGGRTGFFLAEGGDWQVI